MSLVPQPRLCHIKKWPHFDGFGFTLQTDKKEAVQIIGKIDEGSPAEAAGLKNGDRIIEINGVNVTRENHTQVVERIRAGGEVTNLLVADNSCQEYHDDHDIVIRSSLMYIQYLSSEKDGEFIQDDEDTEYDEDFDDVSFSYDVTQDVPTPHNVNQSNSASDTSSSSCSENESTTFKDQKTSESNNAHSYPKTELVAGLHLNMSAKEMRQRVGSFKKADPRGKAIDFQAKYEIINNL